MSLHDNDDEIWSKERKWIHLINRGQLGSHLAIPLAQKLMFKLVPKSKRDKGGFEYLQGIEDGKS